MARKKFIKPGRHYQKKSMFSPIHLFSLFAIFLILLIPSVVRSMDLSPEQQDMVEKLGYPDTFMLILTSADPAGGQKFTRNEIWNYYDVRIRFIIKNGRLVNAEEIEDVPDNVLLPVIYRPEQFENNMTWVDVLEKVIGDRLFAIDPLQEEGQSEMSLVGTEQILFGFEGDMLVFVQTVPIPLNSESISTRIKSEKEK